MNLPSAWVRHNDLISLKAVLKQLSPQFGKAVRLGFAIREYYGLPRLFCKDLNKKSIGLGKNPE
jgi:hypothetical protein